MAHIDYYFSTLSPYVYLAGNRLEAIAAQHGATIAYKPFDLLQAFPRTGGQKPADRHPARLAYRAQELPRQARKLGMALNMKPAFWPVNPAPSSYAIIAAQAAGGGDMGALVHALLRATWQEERDISDDGLIRDCLSAAGFPPIWQTKACWPGQKPTPPTWKRRSAAGCLVLPSILSIAVRCIGAKTGWMIWPPIWQGICKCPLICAVPCPPIGCAWGRGRARRY